MEFGQKEKLIHKERVYELVSLIALKYGGPGWKLKNYKIEHIKELWKYGYPFPCLTFITQKIKVKEVKWYIHNKLNYEKDEIWNSDFLMGLSIHGKLKWNISKYPSFSWWKNKNITELVSDCPFGGFIGKNSWQYVPVFYLKHSKDSLSYMAGAFAGTQIIEVNGIQYAKTNRDSSKIFREWKIPVNEIRGFGSGTSYLLSPIWPALFSIKMPEFFRNRWLELKNPYGVDYYAPILWRTYIDNNNFVKNGIPYLQSRRTIYYHYSNPQEDLTTVLNKMRVAKGLTEIDNRIKEIVKIWASKTV